MMILWIILALLTAAVAAVLILPFARSGRQAASGRSDSGRSGEIAVYRDQLSELERDQRSGLINPEEVQYARAEIGRRLLAAAGSETPADEAPAASRKHTLVTAFVTLVPPAVGLCLYIMLGSPELPAQPLQARLDNPGNNIELLVAKAEAHLAQNPKDGAGWDLLAPIYFRSARLGDAEMAYRNAIRILGPDAARLSGLGETLVAANDGIVTEDARAAFEQSVQLEPANPRASFYVGLGFEQAGRSAEALSTFQTIARESPAGAPWLPLINEHIAKNGGTVAPQQEAARPPGNPTPDDVAAMQQLSTGDRQDAIRGMVDSLAARLQENPDNLEGWLRLVRSYMVLGDRAKAEAALKSGLTQFPADGDAGRQLVALAGETGIVVDADGLMSKDVKQ